jgi:hypothetical protein
MRTPSQCRHRPSVQGGKKQLQDTTHAIPTTPHTCPVSFWHWRLVQSHANSLLLKLLHQLYARWPIMRLYDHLRFRDKTCKQ